MNKRELAIDIIFNDFLIPAALIVVLLALGLNPKDAVLAGQGAVVGTNVSTLGRLSDRSKRKE